MKIVFCLPQFIPSNFKLQPWLTFHRLGQEFLLNSHEVHVITDIGISRENEGMSIHNVGSLRGKNSLRIRNLLHKIMPDAVIVSVSPLSLVTSEWYKILAQFRAYAFLSYPFYKAEEIVRALPYLSPQELWPYGRHLLVPKSFWHKRLLSCFKGVFCQSKRTGLRINHSFRNHIPVHFIPPGIDLDLWPIKDNSPDKVKTVFLYTGWASRIRGFNLLIDVFSQVAEPQMKLVILARGADNREIKRIEKEVCGRLQNHVVIKDGWLDIEAFRAEVHKATVMLQPFILVPSELPVTAMESISCGTPVVVSDIDGLPDAVGDAGLVVKQGNARDLTRAMKRIHRQRILVTELEKACISRRKSILSWKIVAHKWLDIIQN